MKKQEGEQPRHFHWTSKVSNNEDEAITPTLKNEETDQNGGGKKVRAAAISRLLSLFGKTAQQRVVLGTIFGKKRGTHVFFAFQKEAKLHPTLLIQLATPITGLAREMGSGSVRIALESEKKNGKEEREWRSYCNGMKLGLATRMECGPKEWKILTSVGPVSTGAGVLPEEEDEVVYMRAKFERVVGNTDSEAFYMVNPDNNLKSINAAPPELSIYLLRL